MDTFTFILAVCLPTNQTTLLPGWLAVVVSQAQMHEIKVYIKFKNETATPRNGVHTFSIWLNRMTGIGISAGNFMVR